MKSMESMESMESMDHWLCRKLLHSTAPAALLVPLLELQSKTAITAPLAHPSAAKIAHDLSFTRHTVSLSQQLTTDEGDEN